MSSLRIILALCFVLIANSLLGQNGEVQVYSGEKKNFTLFVDGLKENDAPKWKVKVKNLVPGPHHLRVLFDNGQTNTIQKRIDLPEGGVLTFEILKYENATRSWYDLTQVDSVIKEEPVESKAVDSTAIKSLQKASEKVDSLLEVNIPAPKIAVPEGTDSLATEIDSTTVEKEKPSEESSPFNCTNPMLPVGFDLVMKQLQSEAYEDLLLDKAKKLTEENCFSSIQIMEIMQLMEFEVTKLEFAIHAYPHCFDPKNYQFVEDAFEYGSSVNKLHETLYAKPGKKSAIE